MWRRVYSMTRFGSACTLALLAVVALGGCGATTGPSDGGDSGRNDDGTRCVIGDGGVLAPGQSFFDGCNTCTCGLDGLLGCTLRACPDGGFPDVPGDAPMGDVPVTDVPLPRRCSSSSQCPMGTMCDGPMGCANPWTCVPARPCTDDLAQYCSCRGVTVTGSGSCPPEPYSARGPCMGGSDAGPVARLCDPNVVTCRALPPTCAAGEVPSVDGSCWGPCVPFGMCAAIPCDPAGTRRCPAMTACDAAAGRCVLR